MNIALVTLAASTRSTRMSTTATPRSIVWSHPHCQDVETLHVRSSCDPSLWNCGESNPLQESVWVSSSLRREPNVGQIGRGALTVQACSR
jgi:hypothetical protein